MNRTRYIAIASVFLNLALLVLLVFLVNNRSIDFSEVATEVEESLKTENSFSPESLTDVLGEADRSENSDKKGVLVTKVIDGDTIAIEGGEVVRYIGIDTPETDRECFSEEATNKNEELVGGKLVKLEKDISERDRYNRLLRYVYVRDPSEASTRGGQAGQVFVNEELVRLGYANVVSYPPDVNYQELFRDAEREARNNNRGLWKDCEKFERKVE